MGTAKRERQKQNRQFRLQELQRQQAKKKRNRTILRFSIIGVLAVAGLVAFAYLTGDNGSSSSATSTTLAGTTSTTVQGPFTYGTGECPPATGSTERVATFTSAPKQCIDPAKTYTATLDTSEGKIVVKLDTTRTPGTTNNFVVLSRYKYYDGTKIFRTDPSIDIIQGGGLKNTDSPGYTIPDEGGKFTYTEGDFTMARGQASNSGGGQWFFSTGPNTANLDAQGTYVTFGKVTEGMDVLKAIMALHKEDPTSGLGGAPSRDVTVKTVTITES